jgi:Bromodomain
MRQIWENAKIYNDEGSEVYELAQELSDEFETLIG